MDSFKGLSTPFLTYNLHNEQMSGILPQPHKAMIRYLCRKDTGPLCTGNVQ